MTFLSPTLTSIRSFSVLKLLKITLEMLYEIIQQTDRLSVHINQVYLRSNVNFTVYWQNYSVFKTVDVKPLTKPELQKVFSHI